MQSGAARQLMQRLQAAYSHVWQLQLREGLAELVVMLYLCKACQKFCMATNKA